MNINNQAKKYIKDLVNQALDGSKELSKAEIPNFISDEDADIINKICEMHPPVLQDVVRKLVNTGYFRDFDELFLRSMCIGMCAVNSSCTKLPKLFRAIIEDGHENSEWIKKNLLVIKKVKTPNRRSKKSRSSR